MRNEVASKTRIRITHCFVYKCLMIQHATVEGSGTKILPYTNLHFKVLYQNRSLLPYVKVLSKIKVKTSTSGNKLIFWHKTSRYKVAEGRSFVLAYSRDALLKIALTFWSIYCLFMHS